MGYDLAVCGGTLLLEEGPVKKDIAVSGGIIRKISRRISCEGADKVIDARGMFVFPGFIDAHTHYGIPGSADSFYSGSRAAAFGGITTVIDFADQVPGYTLLEGANKRIREAAESSIDYALHQGIYRMHPRIAEEIGELSRAGIKVIKIFSTYKHLGLYLDPVHWKELFDLCRINEMLVTIHAEDEDTIIHRDSPVLPEDLPKVRSREAEYRAVLQAGDIAGEARIPLYVVHLSSARGLDALRQARRTGAMVFAETAPHYLLLDESVLQGAEAGLRVMAPPLRTLDDSKALLEALGTGEISVTATDHCAFTREQKLSSQDCREIPMGIPGSEEMASLLYTYGVCEGMFSISRMREMLCSNPAKIFGIYPRKGVLKPGSDADITIFNPDVKNSIRGTELHSNAGYSVYEGFRINGRPVITISRGRVIADHGSWLGNKGFGEFIRSGTSVLFT